MDSMVKRRESGELVPAPKEKALNFLYGSAPGRVCLKVLYRRTTAKIVGSYMNSRLSKGRIKKSIKNMNIDMSRYEDLKYKSYNQFFTRDLKPEYRNICVDADALIAPCDSKLTVYPIDDNSIFFIKGSPYNVAELLKNKELAEEFNDGYCLVFRLTVDNYHRYCYFDDGSKGDNTYIKGVLHTVNPISLGRYDFYKQNCREYTVMETRHFGKAVQVEVGAMLIGRIKNNDKACEYRRGDEKGMFEFGGSTIVVLLKKGAVSIDADILENSSEGIETVVSIGERIGTSLIS